MPSTIAKISSPSSTLLSRKNTAGMLQRRRIPRASIMRDEADGADPGLTDPYRWTMDDRTPPLDADVVARVRASFARQGAMATLSAESPTSPPVA